MGVYSGKEGKRVEQEGKNKKDWSGARRRDDSKGKGGGECYVAWLGREEGGKGWRGWGKEKNGEGPDRVGMNS